MYRPRRLPPTIDGVARVDYNHLAIIFLGSSVCRRAIFLPLRRRAIIGIWHRTRLVMSFYRPSCNTVPVATTFKAVAIRISVFTDVQQIFSADLACNTHRLHLLAAAVSANSLACITSPMLITDQGVAVGVARNLSVSPSFNAAEILSTIAAETG